MSLRAVILAGGRGTRLAPYTTILPKPLMPVGDMPVLHLLLRQLAANGITRISLAVGYLGHLIMAYFNGNPPPGVEIEYTWELEPLGTAGPLTLVQGLEQTFLVMNGDLLTDVDFGAMVSFHRQRGAAATVGIYERTVQIDLGVIETGTADTITAYVEKPSYHYWASMGVYVFEPRALHYLPSGRRFDLPDLIRAMVAGGEKVAAYRHRGYWLDIGRVEDFERAQQDAPMLLGRFAGT